jgi:protocatechuate 3,4-dioxygenase beta subunit
MARELTRRQAIRLLGAAGVGAAALGACGNGGDDETTTAPSTTATTGSTASSSTLTAADFAGAASCTVTPSSTEGPYYIDVDNIRGDIREDRQGARLRVAARVLDADGCTPVRDAVFEIWHCDAGGLYSGFEAASRGVGGVSTRDEERYLRGAQITNEEGIAELTSVYPGWYRGRTTHIHAKVLISNRDVLTAQLYFDDAVTEQVYRTSPYDQQRGRTTFNRNDSIFDPENVMTVKQDGDGYLGLITIGVRA